LQNGLARRDRKEIRVKLFYFFVSFRPEMSSDGKPGQPNAFNAERTRKDANLSDGDTDQVETG